MAATTTFDAVSNVGSRFHTQRINRRLDDRDNVIKEAIGILEEKDPTYFPTVHLVSPESSISAGGLGSAGTSAVTLCDITGVNFSATAGDWEVMVGGVDGAVTSQSATAGTITCNADLTVAQNDLVLVQIWISETLATEFFITVSAS